MSLACAASLLGFLAGIGGSVPRSSSVTVNAVSTSSGLSTVSSSVTTASTSTQSYAQVSSTSGTVTAADTTDGGAATFAVTGFPTTLTAGQAANMQITLTNNAPATNDEGSALGIASATITFSGLSAPLAVSVQSVSRGSALVATSADGAEVTLSSSNIAPQAALQLSLTVTVPVGSGHQLDVATTVTPSSSKTDGDADDTFDPASQQTSISVQEPSYTLSFASAPTMAQVSQPFCPALTVQLDQGDSPAAVQNIPISLTGLAASGSSLLPELSGTTTAVTDQSGLATFGDCSAGVQIDNLGTFRLQASSTSPLVVDKAQSGSIMVLQSYVDCNGSCTVTVTSPATGVSSTIHATGNGKLGASFDENLNLGCASQVNPGPWDPLFIGGTAGLSGTVTMNFPKSIVNTQSNSGRPHMQICAQAGIAFQGLGGAQTMDGLVADCVDGTFPYTVGPTELGLCVLSRAKGNLGHETVTLLVSDLGDPSFW